MTYETVTIGDATRKQITAEDVTDEMVTAFYRSKQNDYRKDIIVAAVNAYLSLKNPPDWAKASSYPGLDLT